MSEVMQDVLRDSHPAAVSDNQTVPAETADDISRKNRVLALRQLDGRAASLLEHDPLNPEKATRLRLEKRPVEGRKRIRLGSVGRRKKTRDLFDMDYVFKHSSPDVETILRCWRRYKKELGEDAAIL